MMPLADLAQLAIGQEPPSSLTPRGAKTRHQIIAPGDREPESRFVAISTHGDQPSCAKWCDIAGLRVPSACEALETGLPGWGGRIRKESEFAKTLSSGRTDSNMRISIEGCRAAKKTPSPTGLIPKCRGSNPPAPASQSVANAY
jgi:hypothetical protein